MAELKLPEFNAFGGFDSGFKQGSDFVRQRAQDQEELRRNALAEKRQLVNDFQNDYLKASELADNGNMPGAQAIMSRWAPHMDSIQAALKETGAAPGGPPGANPPAPAGPGPGAPTGPPMGGSPVPDKLEFQQSDPEAEMRPPSMSSPSPFEPAKQPGAGGSMMPGGPPSGAPPAPRSAALGAEGGRPPMDPALESLWKPLGGALPEDVEAARAVAPANPPLAASSEKARQIEQARARQVLRFQNPMGAGEMTIDPEGRRETVRAENARMFDQYFANSPDPAIQKYAGQLKPFILSAGEKIKPVDLLKYIKDQEHAEENAALRWALEGRKDDRQTRGLDAHRQEFDIANQTRIDNNHNFVNAMLEAARLRSQNELRAGRGVGQDLANIEQAVGGWASRVDWKKIQNGNRTLNGILVNLESGNSMLERDSLVKIAAIMRGTTATDAETKLIVSHLGGQVHQLIEGTKEDLERGGLTPKQVGIVKDSVRVLLGEVGDQIHGAMTSARTRFGPGSGYENYGSQINNHVQALFQGAGVDVGPIFAQPAEAPKLGSGNPSVPAAAAQMEARKAEQMRRAGKVKGAGQDALDRAIELTKKKPPAAAAGQ